MSAIALTFAVLDSGDSAADLGYVFAANVVPQVLVMLGGGVLADRVGRRPVMLVTDSARLAVQGTLAGAYSQAARRSGSSSRSRRCLGPARDSSTRRSAACGPRSRRADKLPDANALLERCPVRRRR